MLQGHLWIHVTVGEVKTAPTRKDASLSGCHMVYTGNGGAGHFCQCNFPGRIFLRPGIFFAGKFLRYSVNTTFFPIEVSKEAEIGHLEFAVVTLLEKIRNVRTDFRLKKKC
jgi:hypothetical protein